MRFSVVSDLHFEFQQDAGQALAERIRAAAAEVTIVSVRIAENPGRTYAVVERVRDQPAFRSNADRRRGYEMSDETKPRRMSDNEIRTFVLGYCDGRIFTSADVEDPKLIPVVFMPVALGAFDSWSIDECEQIGLFWELTSVAGPGTINGYPMFLTARVMHREDWERARTAILIEVRRRMDIPV